MEYHKDNKSKYKKIATSNLENFSKKYEGITIIVFFFIIIISLSSLLIYTSKFTGKDLPIIHKRKTNQIGNLKTSLNDNSLSKPIHIPLQQLEKEFKSQKIKSDYMDKITNKLYLGNLHGALDYDNLKAEGITNIITVLGNDLRDLPNIKMHPEFKRFVIDIEDKPNSNIIQFFKDSIKFIEKEDKIYIYCLNGYSRGPTVIIAYLMWKTKCSFNEAIDYVRKKRYNVDPNHGFRRQLYIFNELLKENNYDLDKINVKNIDLNKKN